MGISTLRTSLRLLTSVAVFTPSATWPNPFKIFSKDWPLASLIPTSRFREYSPVQVKTKSPAPARPPKVSVFPPRATPNLVISAKPRVIRAALALLPKPIPSEIPDAIAITFFNAPPTDTPTISWLI